MPQPLLVVPIVALRNEKGSYNRHVPPDQKLQIVALRNEKGSYNYQCRQCCI